MGLVRKANVDGVAAGEPGSVDISTLIRQAVTDEIERQRLEKLATESAQENDVSGDGD